MNFQLDQAIEVLERTPGVLRSMLSGLSEPWVQNNYGPESFSPFDVVGHLILGEREDWIKRTKIILEHGERTHGESKTEGCKPFEPFDRYAMYEESKGKSMAELLDTFESLRNENVATLKSMQITPDKLALTGTHPELGSVTLEQLLATWVAHDLNHIHQIAKCMAWQYKDALGPWKEFLGVYKPQE